MFKQLCAVILLSWAVGCGAVDVSQPDAGAGDDAGDDAPDAASGPACTTAAECNDPSKPYCVEEVCVECDDDGACDPGAPVCDPAAHACSGCTGAADCAAYPEAPVCGDDGGCHACTLDSQCASEACDFATGACYQPSQVVRVTPGGSSSSTCGTAADPCGSLAAAAPRVSGARPVVRMMPGTYPGQTVPSSAIPLVVHAAGAEIRATTTANNVGLFTGTGADITLYGVSIEVVAITGATFRGVDVNAGTRVAILGSRIHATGQPATGIESHGTLVVERTDLETTGLAIGSYAGSIVLGQSRVTQSQGVFVGAPVFSIANNVLAYNRDTGLVVNSPLGTPKYIGFNTFVANGQTRTSGVMELDVQQAALPDLLRFNPMSNLFTNARPYTGPTGLRLVNGAPAHSLLDQPNLPPVTTDTNLYAPAGVDPDGRLLAGSAAIDAVASGSVTDDINGDPRPIGAGFDIGADEYAP